MRKTIATACAVAIALFGATAFAAGPGEDSAAPTKPATKAEKEAAKKKRRATSTQMAHGKGSTYSDNTDRTDRSATAAEKSAAKSKRKAEGAAAAKTGSAGGEAKQ